MQIYLNGKCEETRSHSLLELVKERFGELPSQTVLIFNGFQTSEDHALGEGDTVFFIPKGTLPPKDELEAMMAARHTPKVHERMKKGSVAVAGLGGLGSAVAIMLARLGVGRLLLVDFDVVEPSNLNRQSYYLSHLGMKKTQALKQQLAEINPYLKVETVDCKVQTEDVVRLFGDYDILCEAFDDPKAKAMLVNTALSQLPNIKVVAASGMAGFDSANLIQTRKRMERLYICGDMEQEARPGWGLMAPRVSVCAGHQANMILRLLLDLEEGKDGCL